MEVAIFERKNSPLIPYHNDEKAQNSLIEPTDTIKYLVVMPSLDDLQTVLSIKSQEDALKVQKDLSTKTMSFFKFIAHRKSDELTTVIMYNTKFDDEKLNRMFSTFINRHTCEQVYQPNIILRDEEKQEHQRMADTCKRYQAFLPHVLPNQKLNEKISNIVKHIEEIKD